MRALLILWAVAATVLAAYGWTRDPAPARTVARRSAPMSDARPQRLEQRVKELEAALVAALQPKADGKDAPQSKGIRALLAEERALEEGKWNQKDAARIHREILRLIMSDANAHRELMALLERDETQAGNVATYLQSPFAQLVRNSAVTIEVRDRARRLLVEGKTAEQRDAAARILMTYGTPKREDVLTALERLNAEPDAGVRETLLEVVSDHGRQVGLTLQEAAPLLQRLRDQLRRGTGWCATALAYWSSDDADFDLIKAGFRDAKDPGTRMDLLNAFQPETRMAGSRRKQSRAFLLEILGDASYQDGVRDMALEFLKHYTPWDRDTAEAVRRATR